MLLGKAVGRIEAPLHRQVEQHPLVAALLPALPWSMSCDRVANLSCCCIGCVCMQAMTHVAKGLRASYGNLTTSFTATSSKGMLTKYTSIDATRAEAVAKSQQQTKAHMG